MIEQQAMDQCLSKTAVIAESDLLLAAGDRVIMGLDRNAFLWASISGYLLPITVAMYV